MCYVLNARSKKSESSQKLECKMHKKNAAYKWTQFQLTSSAAHNAVSNDIPVVIVDDIQMLVSFERNQKTTNHSGKSLSYLQIIFSLNEENCRK